MSAQDPTRRLMRWMTHLNIGAALAITLPLAASAHDFQLGPLRIDHPYATPTPAAARTGAVYLRTLRNTGDSADRLVGASTPAASRVELHRNAVDAQHVMRMREVPAIDLPARSELKLRQGGEYHLMLIDLKQPLVDGQRFPITLRFEKAGEREVMVWVQTRRGGAAASHPYKH